MSIFDQIASIVAPDFVTEPTVNPQYQPPQRQWVGLTDDDWNKNKHNYDFQKGVDWAEAKLKEKNT